MERVGNRRTRGDVCPPGQAQWRRVCTAGRRGISAAGVGAGGEWVWRAARPAHPRGRGVTAWLNTGLWVFAASASATGRGWHGWDHRRRCERGLNRYVGAWVRVLQLRRYTPLDVLNRTPVSTSASRTAEHDEGPSAKSRHAWGRVRLSPGISRYSAWTRSVSLEGRTCVSRGGGRERSGIGVPYVLGLQR